MTQRLHTGRIRRPLPVRTLDFARLFTGIVPDHPATYDAAAALDWSDTMYGNDAAGDCEAVRWANGCILDTTLLGAEPMIPTQDQVWTVYKTQNPDFDPNGDPNVDGPGSPADHGMESATLANYLHQTGDPFGRKMVAWATIEKSNTELVDAAIAIFSSVWFDVVVMDENQTEHAERKPWDYKPSDTVDGGHAVLGVGYDPDPEFITWTQIDSMTKRYARHCLEQVILPIWPEHLSSKAVQKGLDGATLKSDYRDLTGRDLVLP
jgi:hypothetical protein